MKKYWLIAKNTWDEILTYRLNFVMWRLRNLLTFFTLYYLWFALIPSGETIFGYNHASILTYVLGSALLQSFVLSSRSYALGDDINQGNLSNYLIRPMNYFLYWVAKDAGDKAMNITFAVFELTILFYLLQPPVVIQSDPLYLAFFVIAVGIAMTLYFLFNLILGMIGFWSPEVWAPRFIFTILIGFFSGSYFPLDILPKSVYVIFRVLPFQYFLYFPLKIFLKQVSTLELYSGVLFGILWIYVLYIIVNSLWEKGLSLYTAQGR